jgi:hypothetical protein
MVKSSFTDYSITRRSLTWNKKTSNKSLNLRIASGSFTGFFATKGRSLLADEQAQFRLNLFQVRKRTLHTFVYTVWHPSKNLVTEFSNLKPHYALSSLACLRYSCLVFPAALLIPKNEHPDKAFYVNFSRSPDRNQVMQNQVSLPSILLSSLSLRSKIFSDGLKFTSFTACVAVMGTIASPDNRFTNLSD